MVQSEHSDDPSIEELIEIAKSKKTVDESDKPDEIIEFIFALKLKPSLKEWAVGQNVYWIYRKWCIANNIKPRSRVPFHKIFRKRFNQRQVRDGQIGYGIENKMQFELSVEEWFKMRKHFNDEKAEKAKKRYKVPRTES